MVRKIVNHRVIIKKELYEDGTPAYTAECPTLHVYDFAPTKKLLWERLREGIQLALEVPKEKRGFVFPTYEDEFVPVGTLKAIIKKELKISQSDFLKLL